MSTPLCNHTLLLYLSKKEIAPAEKSAGAFVRTEAADLKINCLG